MRILLPVLLALASYGISQGHQDDHGKRNDAKLLPEFIPVPQLPKNSSSALPPLYQPYSKNKPKFQNEALIRQLSEHPGQRLDHLDPDPGSLRKRDLPAGTCAPGHFDVLDMEPSVDWFNFVSYDIHGVWNSSDKFTGPDIRPHINLIEINDGLSLMWRARINPSKVVLGLGWYGRSFTLTDPFCTMPNDVAQFTTGSTAGECTGSSGTLSNAKIKRLLRDGTGTESYDATAGVRWLTFNTNQWVSFDDGVTMQQKLAFATLADRSGQHSWREYKINEVMGIGTANGVTKAAAASFKEQMANATLQNAIASSCYWSLFGGTCTTGYFDVTEARGQIAGFQQNSESRWAPANGRVSGAWECLAHRHADSKATIVARNSNSYERNDGEQIEDLTCTGGFQAYCCTGFVPSSITNSGNLLLYGQTPVLSKRDGSNHGLSLYVRDHALEKRTFSPACYSPDWDLSLADTIPAALLAPFTFGLSIAAERATCALTTAAAVATTTIVSFSIISIIGWIFGVSPSEPNIGVPTTIAGKASAFGPLPGSRGSGSGKHSIYAYSFDEQAANSLFWATYTYTEQSGTTSTSTPVDHGFRVLDDDPRGLLGNGKQDAYLNPDYDNLLFVDLDGKPIDGRTCDIIYEDDDPHSEVRIVLDEKGNVVDMYTGDPDAGLFTREALNSFNSDRVTVDPTTVTVMTGVVAGSES
ncbi:hypothetical protein PISL3812_09747 [Talaromyces islandicus]|uniref:chitinase n=1 Tax=Talaromyces islandicus TaxID=28573 RepID=A0A0U1MAL2_TALIS|nr:hypothetical protein PISL3812_09747 [Talaromyces islandicus]